MSTYIEIINAEFEKRLKANPLYSKNAFANYLGISPSYLSKILRGELRLSAKLAKVITDRLNLDEQTYEEFYKSVKRE